MKHFMRRKFNPLSAALVLLAILPTVSQAEAYYGSLSFSDDGLITSGSWAKDTSNLSWTVYSRSGYWHYSYTLEVAGKHEISHMIVELSPSFDEDNLRNLSWTGAHEIGTFREKNGNPGMPGSVYGLKADDTFGTTLTILFDSDRAPVWGDFYAKSAAGGKHRAATYLYNSGFSAADPLFPVANGSLQGHLLVPDTMAVPVPGAMLLGSVGFALAGYLLRHKR
jgi:hypothetical protein